MTDLSAEEYTKGIQHLTYEDIAGYGDRIISSQAALAFLSHKKGRKLDRNIIYQKMRGDKLHPMGRYGEKTLYFWKSDIDQLEIGETKRPQKEV